MAQIKLESDYNNIDIITEFLETFINENIKFSRQFNEYEVIALSKIRKGLNADIIYNNIISRFEETKIPLDPLPGGIQNPIAILVKIIVEEIIEAIKNDMVIDVATGPGGNVVGTGASPAGPVSVTGTIVAPVKGLGIAR